MRVLFLLPLIFVVMARGAPLKTKTIGAQCKHETGIGNDTLQLLLDKNLPSSDDEVYKSFIFCLLRNMRLIDGKGEVRTDVEAMENWKSVNGMTWTIGEIKRICVEKGETPADTADLVYRCILKHGL